MEWAKYNRDLLAHHRVYATGTTGRILERERGFKIGKLKSGPLGGDRQIGAKIVENKIDFLIFFWDPITNIIFLAKWTQAKKPARYDIFALSA